MAKPQASFETTLGKRIVDQLVDNSANESKVGYKFLDSKTTTQIAKDRELLNTGQVGDYTWHFFISPVTGKGGASGPLRDALKSGGINYVEHF